MTTKRNIQMKEIIITDYTCQTCCIEDKTKGGLPKGWIYCDWYFCSPECLFRYLILEQHDIRMVSKGFTFECFICGKAYTTMDGKPPDDWCDMGALEFGYENVDENDDTPIMICSPECAWNFAKTNYYQYH